MYHGELSTGEIIPSECCGAMSRWLDCAECKEQDYHECSVLVCTECGASTNDHAETPNANCTCRELDDDLLDDGWTCYPCYDNKEAQATA